MFDIFGEFDTYEELNMTAEGLKNEGDNDSLFKLAAENGISEDFVHVYQFGGMPTLCDVATAAMGKIDVEAAELKPKEILLDWVEYIKASCLTNEELAKGVRKKGKSLKGCIAALLAWSYKNRYKIDDDIAKMAGITNARVEEGIPGMGTAKKLIKEYYLK